MDNKLDLDFDWDRHLNLHNRIKLRTKSMRAFYRLKQVMMDLMLWQLTGYFDFNISTLRYARFANHPFANLQFSLNYIIIGEP